MRRAIVGHALCGAEPRERRSNEVDVSNFHPMNAASAEGIFRNLGVSARAQFKEELIRNAEARRSAAERRT